MDKLKFKKSILGVFISTLIMLAIHYFFISKININSIIQVLIDYTIFWIILEIIYVIFGIVRIKKKKSRKKIRLEGIGYAMVFMIIPVLIIHYFFISKTNINPTLQVAIDFTIFWVMVLILFISEAVIKEINKKRK